MNEVSGEKADLSACSLGGRKEHLHWRETEKEETDGGGGDSKGDTRDNNRLFQKLKVTCPHRIVHL